MKKSLIKNVTSIHNTPQTISQNFLQAYDLDKNTETTAKE